MSSVDHDLLADYLGGALDGTPTYAYVDHLVTTSPEWRRAAAETRAALEAVSADLAGLRDEPLTIPADVASRIGELLDPPKRDPLAGHIVDRSTPRRKRPRWQRWAAPVAVAAAAVTFFALGRTSLLTTGGGAQTADDAARRGSAEGVPQVAAPAATPEPVPTIRLGQSYDRESLSKRRAQNFSSSDNPAAGPEANLMYRLQEPAALRACLDAVALVLPGRPTLVEYATFEGRPAAVISITTLGGGWSFVAGPNCGVAGPDELYRAPLK